MTYNIPLTPGGRKAEFDRIILLYAQLEGIKFALNPKMEEHTFWDVEAEMLKMIDMMEQI